MASGSHGATAVWNFSSPAGEHGRHTLALIQVLSLLGQLARTAAKPRTPTLGGAAVVDSIERAEARLVIVTNGVTCGESSSAVALKFGNHGAAQDERVVPTATRARQTMAFDPVANVLRFSF